MASGTVGGQDMWRVSGEERSRSDAQFFTLKPQNGLLTGEQAREFFIKSQLPGAVLAQIWTLSDLNHDGKMDKKEFSIAMHLIQKKLQGFSLPQTLPDSMRLDPQPPMAVAPQQFGAQPMAVPQQPTAYSMAPGYMQAAPRAPVPMGGWQQPQVPPGSPQRQPQVVQAPQQLSDWSLAAPLRLRYAQQFNAVDRTRVGLLSGVQARNVLAQSGLPQATLAHIWALSDLNRDGMLSCDEFCIAMHLMEMTRLGHSLPSTTPTELIRTASTGPTSGGVGGAGSIAAPLAEMGGGTGLESASSLKTKEDERIENFKKGQAELERRRQILQEQERREREERERKESAERQRREQERLEMERRRQLAQEKELARQREMETQRLQEQQKMMEQREAARRELDRQRRLELDKQRVRELTALRQREVEATCHAKQRHKNMAFQLQALGEKAVETNQNITDKRDRIVVITGEIEAMKRNRDEKMGDIERLKTQILEAQQKLQGVGIARHRLTQQLGVITGSGDGTLPTKETLVQVDQGIANKRQLIGSIKQRMSDIEVELKQKHSVTEERQTHLKTLRSVASQLSAENRTVVEKFAVKQQQAGQSVAALRAEQEEIQAAAFNDAQANQQMQNNAWTSDSAAGGQGGFEDSFGAFGSTTKQEAWAASDATAANISHDRHSLELDSADGEQAAVKYRALYAFSARNDDELSFEPGDGILVFRQHDGGEPGWLAGQLRGKVGWFPASFAEPMVMSPSSSDAPPMPTSPGGQMEKLPSINEESSPAAPVSSASNDNMAVVVGEAQALYPWKARKDTHLSFQKGDVLRILEQQDMWWRGQLGDHTGWFPKSYVKMVDSAKRGSDATATFAAGVGGIGEWYISVYPFAAPEEGDLRFDSGDRIFVTAKDNDWWTGCIGDRVGIFPASYVQSDDTLTTDAVPTSPTTTAVEVVAAAAEVVVTPAAAGSEQLAIGKVIAPFHSSGDNQLELQPGDFVSIRAKSPTGWWQGELQRAGEERKQGWFPANYVELVADTAADETNKNGVVATMDVPVGIPQLGDAVVAVYDYAAQQEGDLNFERGAIIVILEKQDENWWRGKTQDGKEGIFPSNYVQLTPSVSKSASKDAIVSPSTTTNHFNTDTAEEESLRGRKVRKKSSQRQPKESFSNQNAQLHRKLNLRAQELVETEANYLQDLQMVARVFEATLIKEAALNEHEVKIAFANWHALIDTSGKLLTDLKSASLAEFGLVLLKHLRSLTSVVHFCQQQQAAIDLIDSKEKSCAHFRTVYTRCCQSEKARGLPLSYFLLLPMTRVTKYPLIVDQLIKQAVETKDVLTEKQIKMRVAVAIASRRRLHPSDGDRFKIHLKFKDLERAVEGLKRLCADVNQAVTEVENLQMLCWCQNHVRCFPAADDKQQFVFHSHTNCMGSRKYLHSGILYKAKSNRLLVGILFNDSLMLTTPEEPPDDVDGFKLTKTTDVILNLYKTPLLLSRTNLQVPSSEPGSGSTPEYGSDRLITILRDEDTISLLALNGNARMMWTKQIEKAMLVAKTAAKQHSDLERTILPSKGIGRLLIEIVCVRQLNIPTVVADFSPPNLQPTFRCRMSLGDQVQTKEVDISKKETLCTTQFVIESRHDTKLHLRVTLRLVRHFSPDLTMGWLEVPLNELIQQSSTGGHRGPILRQIPLTRPDNIEGSSSAQTTAQQEQYKSYAIIKFVVQLIN